MRRKFFVILPYHLLFTARNPKCILIASPIYVKDPSFIIQQLDFEPFLSQ